MSAVDEADVRLSGSVIVTSTVPVLWLGAVAVILVALVHVALATALPKCTVMPEVKLVPVITTPGVVVFALPEAGLRPVTVGGA